jgi:hypothetical protein
MRSEEVLGMPNPGRPSRIAKIKVDLADLPVDGAPATHALPQVEIAWYENDRVKLTLLGGAPAVIRQAYLTGPGKDVILELAARG